MVIVNVPLVPALTVADCGEAVRLKSAPVPESWTVCGLPLALSLTVSVPVRLPETVGVNVTLSVQDEPAINVAGQLFACEKSPVT